MATSFGGGFNWWRDHWTLVSTLVVATFIGGDIFHVVATSVVATSVGGEMHVIRYWNPDWFQNEVFNTAISIIFRIPVQRLRSSFFSCVHSDHLGSRYELSAFGTLQSSVSRERKRWTGIQKIIEMALLKTSFWNQSRFQCHFSPGGRAFDP